MHLRRKSILKALKPLLKKYEITDTTTIQIFYG